MRRILAVAAALLVMMVTNAMPQSVSKVDGEAAGILFTPGKVTAYTSRFQATTTEPVGSLLDAMRAIAFVLNYTEYAERNGLPTPGMYCLTQDSLKQNGEFRRTICPELVQFPRPRPRCVGEKIGVACLEPEQPVAVAEKPATN